MTSKLVTALKENKNDIRKKVVIVAGITVAAVAAGVVLSKLNAQQKDVLVILPDTLTDTLVDTTLPTE